MPQSVEEKTTRFKKIFPPRVEKLIDGLRLLGNCTNKSNYEWNKDLVKRAWIEIEHQLLGEELFWARLPSVQHFMLGKRTAQC